MYSEYKTLGYSDKKAQELAKGRVTTERILIGVGAATITAAAAYAAYRYYDINMDRYIPSEKGLQTVHFGDVSERIKPGNPFYASYTKRDNTIYASKVFSHFTDETNVTRMYTENGIKVASEKSGRKIFDELCKTNPEVAEYSKRIGYFGKGRKAYERFNYSLVLRNDSETAKRMKLDDLDHDKIHKVFYDELKKRGYGAVLDVNDSRKEGFTYSPVIVFDDQIKHVVGSVKASSSQLHGEQYRKALKWARTRKKLTQPATAGITSSNLLLAGYTYAVSVGATVKDNRTRQAQVDFATQYMQDHPDTKLTPSKINRMYQKSLKSGGK